MSTVPLERKRKRPIAVTFVAVIALGVFFFNGITGALEIWDTGVIQSGFQIPLVSGTNLTETGIAFFGGVLLVVAAFVALIICYGAFRLKRWAWITFMIWCIVVLCYQLLRYAGGSPGYLRMALAVFVVLALNQSEVQLAFGIKRAENVEPDLEPASNNPLDSK